MEKIITVALAMILPVGVAIWGSNDPLHPSQALTVANNIVDIVIAHAPLHSTTLYAAHQYCDIFQVCH